MQNFISVIIVCVLSLLGLITTEPLTWRLIKVWLPVNVIFVGMLITSMFRYGVLNLLVSFPLSSGYNANLLLIRIFFYLL